MLNIIYEKIEDYKSGRFECPVLKVTNKSSKEDKVRRYTGIGYLSPFRYYKFQVSASIDGDGDLGSSNVHYFFKDVINQYCKEDAITILCKELCKCLNSYLQTRYGYPGYNVGYTYNGKVYTEEYYEKKNLQYEEFYELTENDILMQFVEDSYYAVARYYDIKIA